MVETKFFVKASVAAPTVIFTDAQILDLTNYVNAYRAKNQAPPLTWDPTIALYSQNWANYLLANNLFQHSGSSLYGENLAWFQGYHLDMISMVKTAIDAWYNEISLYNFNSPGFSEATGHFTDLVWVKSTTFGMGYSYNSTSDTAIVTFNNNPPGNYINDFKVNVLPLLINAPTPIPTTVPIPTPTIVPTVVIPPTTNITSCITNTDQIQNITNLYKTLKDLNNNKSKSTISADIQQVIKDMTAQL